MSLIKQKQKDFIQYIKPFFENLKGEPYEWIPVMTKRGFYRIQIETDRRGEICSYYVHFYGAITDILTTIYVKRFCIERPYLVCGNYHLHSKMRMMKLKQRGHLPKERRENVEYYYNNIWLSLPLMPELKRIVMEYL